MQPDKTQFHLNIISFQPCELIIPSIYASFCRLNFDVLIFRVAEETASNAETPKKPNIRKNQIPQPDSNDADLTR